MSEEQTPLEEGAATDKQTTEDLETAQKAIDVAKDTVDKGLTEADAETAKDNWGDDWRQNYAGEDDKMVKRMERYSSPKAALDALVAAQNKISSGELKTALQSDASDEETATWREENGIPSSVDDYEINLPNGIVVGEEDKPMVDSFLESALASNLHPDQVNNALGWYYDYQEQTIQQQQDADIASKQTGEDELRVEWGQDYRRNVQIATNFLDNAPEGFKEQIMGARLADGTPLGSDPTSLNWLVDMSRQINPVATVVPGSGTNAVQAIETELASLKSMMGDRQSEYWKGDNSAKNQARYRELVETVQKYG